MALSPREIISGFIGGLGIGDTTISNEGGPVNNTNTALQDTAALAGLAGVLAPYNPVLQGAAVFTGSAAFSSAVSAVNADISAGNTAKLGVDGLAAVGDFLIFAGSSAELFGDLAGTVPGGQVLSLLLEAAGDATTLAGVALNQATAPSIQGPVPPPTLNAPPMPNPVVTTPSSESVTADQTTSITGVSISDPSAVGAADLLTLSLSASSGTISMTNAGGTALAGSGTGTIDVSGSLEQLNADLATLSYTAGESAGSASVSLNVVDIYGAAASGSIGVTVSAAPATGFDGDQVSLTIYDSSKVLADVVGSGTASVAAGTTTFPGFTALTPGPNTGDFTTVNGSLALSGDTMTFLYPAGGGSFNGGSFNGYEIQTAASDPAITVASLVSTNIPGLTASDLSFSAHTVDLNVAGLTLPTGAQGSIVLGFDFAGQSTSAAAAMPTHTSSTG